jgi:hypothetical protein
MIIFRLRYGFKVCRNFHQLRKIDYFLFVTGRNNKTNRTDTDRLYVLICNKTLDHHWLSLTVHRDKIDSRDHVAGFNR